MFYKGIAYSVKYHLVGESFASEQLDFKSTPITDLKMWWKLKREHLDAGNHPSIQLPKVKDGLNWDNLKLRRRESVAKKIYSLPDPVNMTVKAAINFSAILGAKTMPACSECGFFDEDEEMNSTQDEDIHLPEQIEKVDLSSLLRPVQSVI